MKAKDPMHKIDKPMFFQFEPAAFLSDVDFQAMTDRQRGIYFTILLYLYTNNGELAEVALNVLSNYTGEKWEQDWAIVRKKFKVKKNNLTHKRVTKEMKKSNHQIQVSKDAGLKGAKARWGSHSDPITTPMRLPIPSKVKESKVKESNIEERELFDLARKIYPGSKRGNDTEFEDLVRHHGDWKEILPLIQPAIEAQTHWRATTTEFVPAWKMLKTWLRQRCWEEEPVITPTDNMREMIDEQRKQTAEKNKRLKLRYEESLKHG